MSKLSTRRTQSSDIFTVTFKDAQQKLTVNFNENGRKDAVSTGDLLQARTLSSFVTAAFLDFMAGLPMEERVQSPHESPVVEKLLAYIHNILEQAAKDSTDIPSFLSAMHHIIPTDPKDLMSPRPNGDSVAAINADMMGGHFLKAHFAKGVRVYIKMRDDKVKVNTHPELPSVNEHITNTLAIFMRTPLYEGSGDLAQRLHDFAEECDSDIGFIEGLESIVYKQVAAPSI